jgi:hypothetical protein
LEKSTSKEKLLSQLSEARLEYERIKRLLTNLFLDGILVYIHHKFDPNPPEYFEDILDWMHDDNGDDITTMKYICNHVIDFEYKKCLNFLENLNENACNMIIENLSNLSKSDFKTIDEEEDEEL